MAFDEELIFNTEFDMLTAEGHSCPECGGEPIEIGGIEEEVATYGKCELGHIFYVDAL